MLELSAANAPDYLASRGYGREEMRVTELGGGVSNTVLLVEAGASRFVLKQALSKLRVEQDWFSDRNRIFRESRALRDLSGLLPAGALPQVLFEDEGNALFAMTAAPPEAKTWKELLLSGEIDPALAASIGRLLAAMVSATWQSPEWQAAFGDQTVFDQLRLDPYYRSTAQRHPDRKAQLDRLVSNARERRASLVHGDWSPKNFLVTAGVAMAIDFEVIHFGDPAFDSAFLLNHLLLKSFYRPAYRGQLASAAASFWNAYQSGLPSGCGWIERATLEHLGGLLLARIDGKSPAEYIRDPALRDRIRVFARQLLLEPPSTVSEVFQQL